MALITLALSEGIIYGALLIIGGIIGYQKANSKPSLYAGTASGLLALSFSIFGLRRGHDLLALFLLAAEAIVLSAFFYIRFKTTNKFMPSGFMMVVSVVSLILYLGGIIVA